MRETEDDLRRGCGLVVVMVAMNAAAPPASPAECNGAGEFGISPSIDWSPVCTVIISYKRVLEIKTSIVNRLDRENMNYERGFPVSRKCGSLRDLRSTLSSNDVRLNIECPARNGLSVGK